MVAIFTQQPLSKQITDDIQYGENLRFAVAFFSYTKLIEQLLEKGCQLQLIVRLESPTDGDALRQLMTGQYKNQIDIRCSATNTFHSKLYIFHNRKALTGSANLTYKALSKNDEILIELTQQEELDNLNQLFEQYWQESNPLTETILENYLAENSTTPIIPKKTPKKVAVVQSYSNQADKKGSGVYFGSRKMLKKPQTNGQPQYITMEEVDVMYCGFKYNKVVETYQQFAYAKHTAVNYLAEVLRSEAEALGESVIELTPELLEQYIDENDSVAYFAKHILPEYAPYIPYIKYPDLKDSNGNADTAIANALDNTDLS